MSDKQTRETRSPPKNKQNSLERDCRDAYGENNKSRRKAIPLFKAQSNRRGRHLAKVAVNGLTDDEAVEAICQLSSADLKSRHPFKTKAADIPLKDYFEHQNVRRHHRLKSEDDLA